MRLLVAYLAAASAVCAQPTPQATSTRFFDRVGGLAGALRTAHLDPNLAAAKTALSARLVGDGFAAQSHDRSGDLRVGAVKIPVANAASWTHFEAPASGAWVDLLELADDASATKLPTEWRQAHTGQTYADAFCYITLFAENGLDAAGAIAVRGRHVVSMGVAFPFRVMLWNSPGNSAEQLAAIDRGGAQLARMLEMAVTTLKDPAYLTWIPPAEPTDDTVRMRRVASFARFWSEAKYNFVFLNERKNLDWESMLELYLPRILAAKSNDEYIDVLKEAVALLADGHTGVQGGPSTDQPALRIEPVQGRPVLTAMADSPQIKASGLRAGMELISVDDVPADQVRKKVERTTGASTAQSRAAAVDAQLLSGRPGSTVHAVFRDGQSTVDADFVRNLGSMQSIPWRKPSFEIRDLPGGVVYVALNSFGSQNVVRSFDQNFERIVKASGLILDVRENGGGSSNYGYDIIARLIGKGEKLRTSAWKTRDYKPAFRAWGNPEGWHEGTHPEIEARGDTPFTGPVVVLMGPKTFSAAEDFLVPLKMSHRATLVGAPSGGSTGQPLSVMLYQASVRICTKWDRFADGTEFVGVGVQPDVRVEATIADVAAGRDPVLARAQELLAAKR